MASTLETAVTAALGARQRGAPRDALLVLALASICLTALRIALDHCPLSSWRRRAGRPGRRERRYLRRLLRRQLACHAACSGRPAPLDDADELADALLSHAAGLSPAQLANIWREERQP